MGAIMRIRDSVGFSAFINAPREHQGGSAARMTVLRAFEVLETWAARAAQRRQLAGLDARMRRDIGRSEADVLRESAKPFWRA